MKTNNLMKIKNFLLITCVLSLTACVSSQTKSTTGEEVIKSLGTTPEQLMEWNEKYHNKQ
ncbi:MAG: hypothetical protein IKZ88_08580 [Neisseriaceae bacterium]|nr:hypothetical protein [Neisseriaceae bacterium]